MVNLVKRHYLLLNYIASSDKIVFTCNSSIQYYLDIKKIRYKSDEKPVKGKLHFFWNRIIAPSNTIVVICFRACNTISKSEQSDTFLRKLNLFCLEHIAPSDIFVVFCFSSVQYYLDINVVGRDSHEFFFQNDSFCSFLATGKISRYQNIHINVS